MKLKVRHLWSMLIVAAVLLLIAPSVEIPVPILSGGLQRIMPGVSYA